MTKTRIPNEYLLSDVGRLNQLTNPNFEQWQRGAGPFTTNGTTADRFAMTLNGTDTLSVSRDAANAENISYCAACTFVLGTGAGGTQFYQILPGSDFGNRFSGKSVSISARIKTTTPNAVRIAYWDNVAWRYSAYHSGSGQYETLSVVVDPAPAVGSQAQLSVFFSASCTAYIDWESLVPGSVPADAKPIHPAEDLARCQRYYELLGTSVSEYFGGGLCFSTSQATATLRWKARKPVTPTITLSGSFGVQFGGGTTATAGSAAANNNSLDSFLVQANSVPGSPLTIGAMSLIFAGSSTTTVTVEANP